MKSCSGDSGSLGQETRIQNPKNFNELHALNNDIFAWLVVPGTDVDTEVVQSSNEDDNYYIRRDLNGNYSEGGTPYMQRKNTIQMTDPVSVIYGHNLLDGTEFTTLHYFEDKEFFDEHETMTLYISGHVLTYRIVSAYIYDNRHILNSFDFSNLETRQEYFDFVCNPTALISNVRTDEDGNTLKLNAQTDRILQLSTCVSGIVSSVQRYIVTGVLIEDQLTY